MTEEELEEIERNHLCSRSTFSGKECLICCLLAEVKQMRRRMNRIIGLEAQNRQLQEELEKAKTDLGARNRILTEEP